ncbi:uncharacterized protein LOC135941151 [Cloeon dipterum]|uniref:uncharacterized protein LOC135941151 n=1 Tax=Cloeon dipterum TaxID=197152 RepID=UPI00321F6473
MMAASSTTVDDAPDCEQATVSTANAGSQTVALKSLSREETFYTRIRPLAVFNKIFGTFPLVNVLQRDGKLLRHKWLCVWQLYDFLLCVAVLFLFYYSSELLLKQMKNEEEKEKLAFWLGATFYSSAIRGVITFFVSHFYAHKYPELISAIEEYHSGIGALMIKGKTQTTFQKVGPIIASIFLLVMLETTSYMYFSQFTEVDVAAVPVGLSFLFLYMWKELPLNMMICILLHLISRFDEIRDGVREASS